MPVTLRKNARLRIGDFVTVERIGTKSVDAKMVQLSPSITGSSATDEQLTIYLKEYLGM